MPERELAHPAPGDLGQTDQLQRLATRVRGIPARHGHRLQVVLGPARRVEAGGLEHRAHVMDGVVEVDVAPAAEGGCASGDRDQPEQHPQGGGLARAVRAEEAGHPALGHLEGEVVDGPDGAELLGQAAHFDGGSHARRYPLRIWPTAVTPVDARATRAVRQTSA